jgi:hypothetical protein
MAKNQKILSYFDYSSSPDNKDKSSKIDISFVDGNDLGSLIDAASPIYKGMASTELSNIFMPFATSGTNYDYPKFYDLSASPSGSRFVRSMDILPFRFDPNGSGFYYTLDPSGSTESEYPYYESQKGFLAGDKPYPNDYIRHSYDVRGIGLRGPLIMVGWGYDTTGAPFPPGEENNKFKGEYDHGYEIDPKDYVAAPIDLRYDRSANVWRSPKDGYFARIVSSSGYFYHSAVEQIAHTSGIVPYFYDKPNGRVVTDAIEINRGVSVASGTIVFVEEEINSTNDVKSLFSLSQARQTFVAKITGNYDSLSYGFRAHSWVEQYNDGLNFVDMPNGKYCVAGGLAVSGSLGPAICLNSSIILSSGQLIYLWQENYNYFSFYSPNSFFPVKVEMTSGSNGSVSSPATYLYNVRTIEWDGMAGGVMLGSGIALARPRERAPIIAQSGSTGYGSAFYDTLQLKLWDAGEVLMTTSGCT